jgi:hypothetical protein
MKKPDIVGMILERVEQEIEDEWRPPRITGSFRGSELGDCPRALQYANLHYKPAAIDPRLALLFRDGNLHHDAIRAELKKVGRLTNIEHGSWKRYEGVYNGQSIPLIITSTCDLILDGQYVGDIKSITTYKFRKLTTAFVRENYPHYVMQLNIYLDIYQKEWGFFVFKDKNNSALKVLWFKFSPELLQETLNKLAKIQYMTEQKKMIKRPFTKSSWDCKTCPFRQKCWGKPREGMHWR